MDTVEITEGAKFYANEMILSIGVIYVVLDDQKGLVHKNASVC